MCFLPSGWLTSLLRKTTHCFLKCFYVVVYSFDVSCNLLGFIFVALRFIFTCVLDARGDLLQSVPNET